MVGVFHPAVLVIMGYTIRESVNNRVLWIVLAFSLIGVGGVAFVGDYAVVENKRTEIGLLSSFYRFGAVFTVMILVVSTMVREFNDKCLELYLSLPLSRGAYLFGKLFGFFVVGAIVAAVFVAVLGGLYADDYGALAFWFLSLVCELMIITSVSFFCVMTFNQQAPVSIIVTFFFYLLCRVSDEIVLVSQSDILLGTTLTGYMDEVVQALVYVLPALGRFTQPEWLMYGVENALLNGALIIGQAVLYTLLLGGAAFFDFYRKNL